MTGHDWGGVALLLGIPVLVCVFVPACIAVGYRLVAWIMR